MSGPPDWLDPLYDAAGMRAVDAWAIEQRGVPSLDLMELAGAGLAALVALRAPAGRVVAVCGKGNNGGDGLVAARLLREQGREVEVLVTADPSEFQGDAEANLYRLPGDPPRQFGADALGGASAIVDALLGTGFSGQPREPVSSAIEAINATATDASRTASGPPQVIAADVPSGVDASTGAVEGAAVRAHATATFHASKVGLWIAPGKEHAGEVEVVEIGIPQGAPPPAAAGLISARVRELVPLRHAGSTKFSEGAVLVVGGSRGLTGAPCLAAEAAQRAGAGYVTACVPESLNLVFEVRLLEAMSRALPDDGGALGPSALDPILEAAERADAVVLGPGLGRAEPSLDLARTAAARLDRPLLLDADGLNAHAGRLADLSVRTAPTVLTPHAGELARLLDTDSAAVAAARLESARTAARRSGAVVVLKGDDTIVAAPDGATAISPGGGAGLATAGTGDVLSGIAGALLAKRLDPFAAACAAVHLHSEAGHLAAAAHGPDATIARDVIEALPAARARRR